MPKIFITNPADTMAFFSERALEVLRPEADLVLNTEAHDLSTEGLIEAARDCDVIIAFRQTPGEAALFAALPNLCAFVRCAVDIRTVDVEAASQNGVLVTQTSRAHDASVSEWILGAMIDLSRKISDGVCEYRQGREPVLPWGRELRGSTVGVIGYGSIAKYFSGLATALGMGVIVYDPYAVVDRPEIRRAAALSDMLQRSDYVVCLAVATPETENMLDETAFSLMKPGAFFINASRGNLVDEDALFQALERGKLTGCGLDVGRAPDQKPPMRLAGHPRVVASPHIGGATPEAADHQAIEAANQARSILLGQLPVGAVNADRATRFMRFRETTG